MRAGPRRAAAVGGGSAQLPGVAAQAVLPQEWVAGRRRDALGDPRPASKVPKGRVVGHEDGRRQCEVRLRVRCEGCRRRPPTQPHPHARASFRPGGRAILARAAASAASAASTSSTCIATPSSSASALAAGMRASAGGNLLVPKPRLLEDLGLVAKNAREL